MRGDCKTLEVFEHRNSRIWFTYLEDQSLHTGTRLAEHQVQVRDDGGLVYFREGGGAEILYLGINN